AAGPHPAASGAYFTIYQLISSMRTLQHFSFVRFFALAV
ncbi:MAG: hypothetical protein AVDCRST_MAG56-4317, partial [uncultured Cytophagales bacterium]